MFTIFKKKSRSIKLFSPVDGEIITLEKVSDEVFSSMIMGDGFAVKPTGEEVFSPIVGEVISIFPTKHAVALKTAQGLEVLLHMGIDTVELQGLPFKILVELGEKITNETQIATFDLSYLTDRGKIADIMVVLTNIGDLKGRLEGVKTGVVKRSTSVGKVSI